MQQFDVVCCFMNEKESRASRGKNTEVGSICKRVINVQKSVLISYGGALVHMASLYICGGSIIAKQNHGHHKREACDFKCELCFCW